MRTFFHPCAVEPGQRVWPWKRLDAEPNLRARLLKYVSAIYINWVDWEERLADCEGFEWDAANVAKIWDRHHVTPAECEELFFNRPLVLDTDERHSAAEERLYALARAIVHG